MCLAARLSACFCTQQKNGGKYPVKCVNIYIMMIIASISRAHKGEQERGEVRGGCRGIWGEEEGNADYWGMVQPSQQHVIPCVKMVKWGFGTRGMRMLAAFWVGIQVEVTKEVNIVSHCRLIAIKTPFQLTPTTYKETMGIFYPPSPHYILLL